MFDTRHQRRTEVDPRMSGRTVSPREKADRSFHAYSALMLCFLGMTIGAFAIRSHRDEVAMRTQPAVSATVLSVEPRKGGFAAWITFTRVVDGAPVICKTQTALGYGDDKARVGAVIRVIPRSDSCGEPVEVGERHPTFLAGLSGIALIASLAFGVSSALSILRSAGGKPSA